MAHHIYTTEGIVLGGVTFGESNAFFHIFTRELGLVVASARSVRAVQSKLRYGLQDFSISTVSLVRGKHEWKVTNVVAQENIFYTHTTRPSTLAVCAHTLALIKKLVAGEEKNETLFDIVRTAFVFFSHETLSSAELRSAECVLMLRIVDNLGYLNPSSSLRRFVETSQWTRELVGEMEPYCREAVREINASIKESQL